MAPIRFTITVDTGRESWRPLTDRPFVISPDGRPSCIARWLAACRGCSSAAWTRSNRASSPQSLLIRTPFFSPDGRWVGFFDSPALLKVPASGGPPVTLCQTRGGSYGASWGDDDSIVFAVPALGTGGTGSPAS